MSHAIARRALRTIANTHTEAIVDAYASLGMTAHQIQTELVGLGYNAQEAYRLADRPWTKEAQCPL